MTQIRSQLLPSLVVVALTSHAAAQIERPIPYPIPRDGAWAEAVEAGTRTNRGTPGEKYWTNYAKYAIEAELDPKTAIVTGSVKMTYENRSPKTLRRLAVHLRHNAHKEGNLRNRYLEVTGGVEASNLRVDGDSYKIQARRRFNSSGASITGTVMTISLEDRLQPGDSVEIELDWKYKVPARGAPRNGRDGFHTYYLGYWYPQFAVLEDVADDWVAEQYRTNAEFYMGYADYDLRFTAPKGWLVRATGELRNADKVLRKEARQRLEQAREGREIVHVITEDDIRDKKVTRMNKGSKLTWHFVSKNVRDIAVSISDRYVWDATHAVVKDRDGPGKDGIAMIHAVYRKSGAQFTRAAEYARHTIEYMSENIYPYPWEHMTVCGGVIGGGMEYPMMTICGSGSLGLVAHELIHMWFPMIVGTNEKARAWQDEGFTSYFTGVVSAAFRDRPLQPRQTLGRYLRTAQAGELAPLMTHGDKYPGPGRSSYSFASYSKSAAILTQLRELVGDEVFLSTFRKYVADWAYKHPRAQDFFSAFNEGSGRDLDWYFRTWYYETWTLDQCIESVTERGDKTEVVVADLRYATYPTTVAVTYADGRTDTRAVEVSHWLSGKKSKTLEFDADVEKVELNPGRATLDVSARNNVWKRK